MDNNYILSCESTIDLPYSYTKENNLSIIYYTYAIDGEEFIDDMGKNPDSLTNFYEALKTKVPSTSQINIYRYLDYFEELLEKGDVVHVAFGSGMTPSIHNARQAAQQLKEKFPDRKIIVLDSYCSSSGYGLLVDACVDLRDNGASMEDIRDFVNANGKKVQHQFFSTDLKYLKRGGRVSGPAATIGSVLGICPTMRLDNSGHIFAYGKVRGKKSALKEMINAMINKASNGVNYNGKVFISHSSSLADALELKRMIVETFPNINGEVRISDIGTIIASHTGPGTLALFFFGEERE